MYTCEKCKRTVPPHTEQHRVAIETRKIYYPERKFSQPYKDDGKRKFNHDPGGIGYETVREIAVCPDCAADMR